MKINRAKNYEVYNKGSNQEIEAIFFKNWRDIKRVLHAYLPERVKAVRGCADPIFKGWK